MEAKSLRTFKMFSEITSIYLRVRRSASNNWFRLSKIYR